MELEQVHSNLLLLLGEPRGPCREESSNVAHSTVKHKQPEKEHLIEREENWELLSAAGLFGCRISFLFFLLVVVVVVFQRRRRRRRGKGGDGGGWKKKNKKQKKPCHFI